jgi:hypothetical protein
LNGETSARELICVLRGSAGLQGYW